MNIKTEILKQARETRADQGEGLKFDQGKQGWYPLPLVILRPLADVFLAGEKKYAAFNCLLNFDDPDRRFWDATMRHIEACQMDPMARDPETGAYHAAAACFNLLMRIYHCGGHNGAC